MNVEGQYNPKDVECISVENLEVLPSGADWQSRHLESEKRKAEIRDRIHKQAEQGQKTAKDYFRPAKPTPSIYDSDLKRVAVYARVSTSSEEQISSIENQTLYYTKKIAETENWNLQDIYSDEGKSGTSLRKGDAFKRMMRDAKDQKACHSRLDDCEYVELLYHPILQVVILRKSDQGTSTAMHWQDDNDVHSAFSARAFSGLILQTLNWKMNCRYQCRGICRGQGNAKFLIFELDESRILTGKNQYEQENCSINLKCRLYRSKWVQSITVSDVMESGQVVENPMIGAIPSRNEVQRELDDLLMSM